MKKGYDYYSNTNNTSHLREKMMLSFLSWALLSVNFFLSFISMPDSEIRTLSIWISVICLFVAFLVFIDNRKTERTLCTVVINLIIFLSLSSCCSFLTLEIAQSFLVAGMFISEICALTLFCLFQYVRNHKKSI